MDITVLDAFDIVALTRYKLKSYENTTHYDSNSGQRKALLITLKGLWPETQKNRALRLAIVSALLGKPVSSMKDNEKQLKWHETKILLEVLNDNKEHFPLHCRQELQVLLEGRYLTEPWSFPFSRPDTG